MKYLNNSDHVVNFSVAVNERWKSRNGESQERSTWLRIVAFNGIGSARAEHLKQEGHGVYVEGRLQIREYQDKDEVERLLPRSLHRRSVSFFRGGTKRSWRRRRGSIWMMPIPLELLRSYENTPNHADRVLRCKTNVFCSAGPRGFCGDLRQFADSEKKPQVFRKNRGSPALPNKADGPAIFSRH